MPNTISRRLFIRHSCLALGALAVGAFSNPITLQAAESLQKGGKVLIVYYSRTGNTATMAKYIQTILGADMLALETVQPYPEEYRATTEQAKRELETGFMPPLKTSISNMDVYTHVFVGSPNWWGTIAPPVMTFLSSYDTAGKTLVPFITHEGSGLARSGADIKKLCPKASVVDGLAIRGRKVNDAQPEVAAWLNKLGLAL